MTKCLSRSNLILVLLVFVTSPLRADSIPEIVAKTKPAVVEIVTSNANGTTETLGTGFFVSPDGLVVTNRHVIEGANSITAINNNGAIFLFERVVNQPPGVDLAVLKFHAADVPFLKLGESATAVEGQKVIVIGNPTGLMGTVSDGIISAFRKDRSYIQITAPISPGSSGSPVLDEDGNVIGVAALMSVQGQSLNFAISVEEVSAALSSATPPQVFTPFQRFVPPETQQPLRASPQQEGTPDRLENRYANELDHVYSQLCARLPPRQREYLRGEEQSWIKEHEHLRGDPEKYVEMTHERLQELRRILNSPDPLMALPP